jgi:hypothetical protein
MQYTLIITLVVISAMHDGGIHGFHTELNGTDLCTAASSAAL